MALSKAPPMKPVKTPPMTPPPVPKTKDDYSHHTSPNKGPQAVPPETVTAQAPRAKVKVLPDAPMHVTKHGDDS